MSKCKSLRCENEGWASEPVPGVSFCYLHWDALLSSIAKEKTSTKDAASLYRGIGFREKKVYFLAGSGHVKIGFSMNPIERLRAIRSGRDESMTPAMVDRSALDCIGFIPGGRSLELELHKRFDKFRVEGEWFIASPGMMDSIRQMIANAA